MKPWGAGRLAPFDLETDDKDPLQARIVSAAVMAVGDGRPTQGETWLLSPGEREISAESTKIHGITTEYARANGTDAAKGVDGIAGELARSVEAGMIIVGHNLAYDATVLKLECERFGVPTVEDRLGRPLRELVCTLILDKHADPYRKRVSEEQGAHQLKTCAQVYEVGWDDESAHGAEYDCLTSARVAYRICRIAHQPHRDRPDWVRNLRTQHFDDLAGVSVDELFALQQLWAFEQAASFQEFLRSPKAGPKQDRTAVVDGSWPVRSIPAVSA